MNTCAKYIEHFVSVIPVKTNKQPLIAWKQYQGRFATPEEYAKWRPPIAAVCGRVSRGLCCIDFDNKGSEFKRWGELVIDAVGNRDIMDRLVFQRTPSGGYHAIFRTTLEIRNTKLAKMNDSTVLIETRGEGGYFLIDPSDKYEIIHGSIENITTLEDFEVEILLGCARSLNKMVTEDKPQSSGLSPFDDYNARNTPLETLKAHGWTLAHKSKEVSYLRRSGKSDGISATWNHVPNRFFVFTTSTEFDSEKVYKTSAVYAILEHGGDFSAAAKALSGLGYGEKKKEPVKKESVNVDLVQKTTLMKASTHRQRIYDYYKSSRNKGFSTGIVDFDKILRFDHGYLNVITGIPTHGKSEFLDFVTVLLAKKHGWHFTVFSPENYPLEIHVDKLAQKFHKMSMFGQPKNVLDESIEFVDRHYSFIDATEDDISLDLIMAATLEKKTDCLIIDPWNEIESSKPAGISESDFTGTCLRRLRKFARKNQICVFVVAHPTKMYRLKDKDEYPVPTLYDISGSANWYNKSDNGMIVHRDFKKNITTVYVKKVKYRSYGELGHVEFFFDTRTGHYEKADFERDLVDF